MVCEVDRRFHVESGIYSHVTQCVVNREYHRSAQNGKQDELLLPTANHRKSRYRNVCQRPFFADTSLPFTTPIYTPHIYTHTHTHTPTPSRSSIDCDRNLAVNQNRSFFAKCHLVRISVTRENIFLSPFLFPPLPSPPPLSLVFLFFFFLVAKTLFAMEIVFRTVDLHLFSGWNKRRDGGRICRMLPTCGRLVLNWRSIMR